MAAGALSVNDYTESQTGFDGSHKECGPFIGIFQMDKQYLPKKMLIIYKFDLISEYTPASYKKIKKSCMGNAKEKKKNKNDFFIFIIY